MKIFRNFKVTKIKIDENYLQSSNFNILFLKLGKTQNSKTNKKIKKI